jgi:DNA-binding SARP family transcriptional activator
VEFRVLGSLEAAHDGRRIELGTPRMRAMLALLLLRAGQVVAVEQIIDELWPEGTDADARAVVHVYASRLRRALGQPGLVLTRTPGYLIQIDPDQVDLHRFDELVAQAREAADGPRRVALFDQALSLWRGPAFADLPASPVLAAEAARLGEHRLAVVEESLDARLAVGQSGELVAELTALVLEHPLRERPHALLMRALYRSGRQAEALDVYQRLRRRLADELGIDPSHELRALHQRMLVADPALDAQPTAARTPVPRQLPAPAGQFVGRADELKSLTQQLESAADRPAPVLISSIGGGGGIGKTWFAVHWAHEHLDRFPDGQLYVDLRGYDPAGEPMTTATAVRGFLDALGVNPSTVPLDLDARAALYRSLVVDKRMLVVLDNARDTAHVTPLLPGTPSCTVLVTSRHLLGGLITTHRAMPLTLGVLSDMEARELLCGHLGRERIAAEPEAVAELVAHCAGLPLALSILTARAAMHPDLRLADLAAELRDASSRLDVLDAGELSASLRAVFSSSYAALDPEAARSFGLLGQVPGPDIDLRAAAALLGLPLDDAAAVLRDLVAACLIQEHTPGRYQMHDLVRLYAADQGPADATALRRLVDFYVATANAADHALDPHRPGLDLESPVDFPDRAAATAWFAAEHACLIAAQQLAVRHGWHTLVWQVAWVLGTYHRHQYHPHDDHALWVAGAAAADQLGDPVVQARAQRRLGFACLGLELPGHPHFELALAYAEQAGDVLDQARTHFILAAAWDRQGEPERGLAAAANALELHRSIGNEIGEADALNAVGFFSARVGRYEEARATCEAALDLSRRLNNRSGVAEALDSLGYIAQHTGRLADAAGHHRESAAVQRELGSVSGEANSLVHLGEVLAEASRAAEAREAWERAVALYESQGRAADGLRQRIRNSFDQADEPD